MISNSSQKILLQIFFGLFLLLGLKLVAANPPAFLKKYAINRPTKLSKQAYLKQTPPETKQKTLGRSTITPRIYITGGKGSMGGVISMTSLSEPKVEIESYQVSGKAEISVYKASSQDLLNYLIHDQKGSQKTKNVDTSKLQHHHTFEANIQSGHNAKNSISLPVTGSGVWFLQIALGQTKANAFIVRSNIGAVLKEGDNEFIIWGQDLQTKRSLTNANFKVYSLLNEVKEIANPSFKDNGIAKTNLTAQADIGLVEKGEDITLVPINLRYLNYGSSYQNFTPKKRQAKFFTFTDRPVYKPGDLVSFKSIIRDDDDARYTVPGGTANIKVTRGWGEQENVVYQMTHPIMEDGTVYGAFNIPADSRTGHYTLMVDLDPSVDEHNWMGYRLKSATSFQVEYYRKPEYTIDISVAQQEFIAGDKSSFKISGHYFFGQPLAKQTVKYKIYSSDFWEHSYLTNIGYQLNDDYHYGWRGGKVIKEGLVDLDNRGEAQLELELKPPSGVYKSQVFSLEAQYSDGTANPVFARKNILVYSGEYGIYKKSATCAGQVGKNFSLPLVLKPRQNSSIANISLTAKLQRSTWIKYQEQNKKYPSYRKEEENLPQFSATTDNSGNATFKFTPAKHGSYKLSVEGKDNRGNTILKEFSIWVVSPGKPLYRGNGEKSGLTIQPDKEQYSHTDTLRITINSDIENRDVLLSFDRARVNRFQVVHLEGFSTTIEAKLVETDIPNIFLKAASFSDNSLETDRKNIIVSSDSKKLVVAIAPDKKNYGPGETVKVNVETTDTAGNPVSASTAVWAVDKALFELIDQNPLRIFEAFWSQRYDDTRETHSLQGINVKMAEGGGCFTAETPILMANAKTKAISQVKVGDWVLTRANSFGKQLIKAKITGLHHLKATGHFVINGQLKVTPNHRLWVNGSWKEAGSIQLGDILKDFNNKNVVVETLEWQDGKFTVYNIIVEKYHTFFAAGIWVHNQKGNGGTRTIFKDTAYWNPSLKTGSDGRASVSFKLPDNLTTWVLSAVGSTQNTKVGKTTKEIVVSKDVVIRPILPNILRTDDEIVLSALVQNFSDSDYTFNIDHEFDCGEVESPTHSGVLIKSKDLAQVYWKVRPANQSPNAKLTFSAWAQDDDKIYDTVVSKIPVWTFGFWEKRAEFKDGPAEFTVKLSEYADLEKSKVKISLASSLLGTLPSAMRYLVNYPWGCVEQTTSRFVPAIIAKANPEIFPQTVAEKDVDDIINKGVQKLAQAQKLDGGWAWWSHGNSDAFVTAYVVEYLLEAKKLGAKVDEDIFTKTKTFLKNESSSKQDLITKTYALFLLQDERGKKHLSDLNGLSADVLSLAVITNAKNKDFNPQTNGLDLLVSLAQAQGDGVFWSEGDKRNYGSISASTAFALRAILAAKGDRKLAVKATRYLLASRQRHYWSNTFGTAQIIRAVVDFSKAQEDPTPDYTYKVKLDGRQIAQGSVKDYRKPMEDILIEGKDLKKGGSKINIWQSEGKGQIYSTLQVEEYNTNKDTQAVANGLTVKKEYMNDKGTNYTLGVGDTITVKITVSGLATPQYYGVIVDQLPSGMIPVNPSFKSEQYGQPKSSYSYGVSDRQITQNGIVLGLYKINKAQHTYTYKARVVSQGVFSVPPATASLMYSPEIYGHSNAQTIKTDKTAVKIPGKGIEKLPFGERVKELITDNLKSLIEKKLLLLGAVTGIIILLGGTILVLNKKKKLK